MNSLNDTRGLKLEIKSLKEDIDFYKSKLEVAEFKLKQQSIKAFTETTELNKKISQSSQKSVVNQSKEVKSLLKQIQTLTTKNLALEFNLIELSDKLKQANLLKKQTKNSAKKIRDTQISNYLANIIEDIIDEDGELMPSVAMRIRSYTKQLKDGADLAVIQPFLEDLIIVYNSVKQAEKAKLKKTK